MKVQDIAQVSAIKWDDGADALLNQRNDADTAQGGVLLTANAG
ncbi:MULTISPECIES: hypothetical protein [Dickeya]|nr:MULTISPECIES: hypothetical protein [Dickeya]